MRIIAYTKVRMFGIFLIHCISFEILKFLNHKLIVNQYSEEQLKHKILFNGIVFEQN